MIVFHVWDLQDDIQKYDQYISRCVEITPFHLTEYLLAEMQAEDGVTKIFCCEEDGDFALMPGVVRRIKALPYMADLEEELYDMITPHEYGGIVSNNCDDSLKCNLLKHILQYAKENKIIFNFVRLNPYLKDLPGIYRKNGYDVVSSRQVYVDTRQTEEQIKCAYKANVRYGIRRAEKEGLRFFIAEKNLQNTDIFRKGYQKAMEILDAKNFLYFNKKYFEAIVACECSRVGVVADKEGTVVAATLMLVLGKSVYYHLSWFSREYALKRPMNLLVHSMILWAKEMGDEIVHLGGGGESLKKFKDGYSGNEINYYIAYQVCDRERYHAVCEKWKKQFPEYIDKKYYPLYRYNE